MKHPIAQWAKADWQTLLDAWRDFWQTTWFGWLVGTITSLTFAAMWAAAVLGE